MRIGILALQGAFIEHEKMLNFLGCECVELRQKKDLSHIDGLVLPGGESTVQGKLLRELDMFDPLKALITDQIPVLATCSGLILLAQNIVNDSNTYFSTLPITVRRNAYGRQSGSFQCIADYSNLGPLEMTFIRAPYIEEVSKDVTPLATVDHHIVAARYQNQIGLSFHPELGHDTRIHEQFLSMVKG